ncbi:MAG: membrane protein insertase YidC, partial [Betaproteobacteria bacterium]
MDTQRLILFVIFSFSALLLWEAWQKETRPPPAPVAAAAQQGKVAPAADLPAIPTTPAAPGTSPAAAPGVPGAGPAAVPAVNAQAAPAGQLVTITTDLYRAVIDATGGTITEVSFSKHRDPHDATKPYTLLLRTADRTLVAQSG